MAYIWLDNPRKNQNPVSSTPAGILHSQSTQLEEVIRNRYTLIDEKVWLLNLSKLVWSKPK